MKNLLPVLFVYFLFLVATRRKIPDKPKVERPENIFTVSSTDVPKLRSIEIVQNKSQTPAKPITPVEQHHSLLPPKTPDVSAGQRQKPAPKVLTLSMNVMVCVLSRRSAYETRQVIRDTWASKHNNVFFAVGKCCPIPPQDRKKWTCTRSKSSSTKSQQEWNSNCAKEDLHISSESDKHGDIITMPDVDVYRHLPQKVKYCYKWGTQHTTANWFVKTDDDSVVRVNTLENYLQKTYDPHDYMVIGRIAKNWNVPRGGKWAESKHYKKRKYPNFPLGSVGHVVSRNVASYIVENSDRLFNYQGEDVSIGIWLKESHLHSLVKWVTSKHMTNHGNCKDTNMWVIGHNIKPSKMKSCFRHKDEVGVVEPTKPQTKPKTKPKTKPRTKDLVSGVFRSNSDSRLELLEGTYCDGTMETSADRLDAFNNMIATYNKKTSASHKYMVYKGVKGSGGWGSKLWGIANVFLLAILSERKFVIEYDFPYPLRTIFKANIVDWTSPVHSMKRHKLRYVDKTLPRQILENSDFKKLWAKHDVVEIIGANGRQMPHLWKNQNYNLESIIPRLVDPKKCQMIQKNEAAANRARALGQSRTMFPMLWHTLFRPADIFMQHTETLRKRIRSYDFVIGIQLRIGTNVGGAYDSHGARLGCKKSNCVSMKDWKSNLLRCANDLTQQYRASYPSATVGWFLTSDQSHEKTQWLFGQDTTKNVVVFDSKALRTVHSDRSAKITMDEWHQTIGDWLALSESSVIIQSASSFSGTAAMWKGKLTYMIGESRKCILDRSHGLSAPTKSKQQGSSKVNLDQNRPVAHRCKTKPSGKKWDTFTTMIGILNDLNANYSIAGGTVLFWYRDCSLGDSDIDINIDWHWFVSHSIILKNTLKKNKFTQIHKFGQVDKYGYEEAWKKNGIKVDLFTQAHVNGKYISGTTINSVVYPCYSFLQRYVVHTWNSLKFRVPEPVEPYLQKKYGNWKTPERGYHWAQSPFKRDNGRFFCDKAPMPVVTQKLTCCLPTEKRCQWHLDRNKIIPQCEKENLLEMLMWIKTTFDEQVEWYLTAGTLLGVARSQSHIPYETDIDIMISERTFKHAMDLIQTSISSTHYELNSHSVPARLSFGSKNKVHVDLWKGKFDAETQTAAEYMKGHSGFGYYTFPNLYSTIFPLKECEYEAEKYRCPNDYLKWVRMRFGNDWRTPKRKYGRGSTYSDGKDSDRSFVKYKKGL